MMLLMVTLLTCWLTIPLIYCYFFFKNRLNQPEYLIIQNHKDNHKDNIITPIFCDLFTDFKKHKKKQINQTIIHKNIFKEELNKKLLLQQIALEYTTDGILIIDNQGAIFGWNENFIEMWNISSFAVKKNNISINLVKLLIKQLINYKYFFNTFREIRKNPDIKTYNSIYFKDGRIIDVYSQPQQNSIQVISRVWIFRDVTAHKLAEAKINHHQLHDILTNLPNRISFSKYLEKILIQAKKRDEKIAVLFLDIDRFKRINDTLGHAIGDILIQRVSQRLKTCLRDCDIIARWGGDEFTLLLPKIQNQEELKNIAERILSVLTVGFEIDNNHLYVSASMGIAIYPYHGENEETLIKHADAALYKAKFEGRNNYQFYHPAINSQASELLILENSLHSALEKEEFNVFYQPQVNIITGEIGKMEALLRWRHPQLGLISPDKFIPITEENGLIVPIGEWVLKTACQQNKIWQETLGLPHLSVAVNLSLRQFQQSNLVSTVKKILEETNMHPHCLELEITESLAAHNIDFTKSILTELHDIGVSISIDDFGTGYCSLSYLQKFPINALKIDKSFVSDLVNNKSDTTITRTIIALAQGLNLSVVAEGVETEEQRNLLRMLECEVMQGYLFSPPVSSDEATKLLKRYKFHAFKSLYLAA
jgi:diguanylate cyclase (GGDEF)-like protein